MPKFTHKKSGYPVTAVQFTDFESAEKMAKEMSALAIYRSSMGVVRIGGAVIKRGQYAVMSMAAIVAMDCDVFNRRFRPVEIQMDIFDMALTGESI